MLLNDLFKIAGEDGDIAGCIALVMRGGPTAKYAVLIPAGYNGPTTYSNPQNVPIIDLRTNGAGLGGPLAGSVGPAGANGAAGTSNVPWFDIQNYGGVPKSSAFASASAAATTVSGSPDITIAAGTFATNAKNGMGVTLYKAGPATSQSTPSAPAITSPVLTGGQTLTYACVGYDAQQGLTAASASATVTNAPAVFGSVPATISSISQSSGTVTVNFSAPLNNTVTAGMTLHITGFGAVAGDKIFNGVWLIATAPTTSQVTFSLAGSYGSGTVSASTKGRVSNAQLITAISRSAAGVITITTAQSNNCQVGSIIIVENVAPLDLYGHWVVATVNGNTITCNTGNYTAETGVVQANSPTQSASTATVWERTVVSCPVPSGTTIGYYIYGDSPNPGGSLVLLGKTVGTRTYFDDYGPFYGGGFLAPAYVPTTAPGAAQNQLFTSTILSGQGTTSLVLSTNVTSSVAALGSTIVFDDGPALLAAYTAGANITNAVLLSAPLTSVANAFYVFNSPITVPGFKNIIFGNQIIANETITFSAVNNLSVIASATGTTTPQFGQIGYLTVEGLASPMFSSNGVFTMDGLVFRTTNNGIIQFFCDGLYSAVADCSFDVGNCGTAVGACYENASSARMTRINTLASSILGNPAQVGQSDWGPPVGVIWLRATELSGQAVPMAQFAMDGNHTGFGRGILIDSTYESTGQSRNFLFGDQMWMQGASTPTYMVIGPAAVSDVTVSDVINDSSFAAVIGNFGAIISLTFSSGDNAGSAPIFVGNAITDLDVTGVTAANASQNVNAVIRQAGNANIGSLSFNPPATSSTYQGQPLQLGSTGVVFAGTQVTGVTATASGSGTFTAETWTVQVSVLGFDGNESALSAPVSVTVNGSQGIAVSWNALPGYAGYLVYLNGFRQSNTPIAIGTTSHTYTSFGNFGPAPNLGATGPVSVSAAGVVTQKLILSVGGAPANSSAAGSPGQFAWDGTYLYLCTAPNTWQRVATSSF